MGETFGIEVLDEQDGITGNQGFVGEASMLEDLICKS